MIWCIIFLFATNKASFSCQCVSRQNYSLMPIISRLVSLCFCRQRSPQYRRQKRFWSPSFYIWRLKNILIPKCSTNGDEEYFVAKGLTIGDKSWFGRRIWSPNVFFIVVMSQAWVILCLARLAPLLVTQLGLSLAKGFAPTLEEVRFLGVSEPVRRWKFMWVASWTRPVVPLLAAPRLISLIPFGSEDTFYFVQKREYSLVDKSMLIIFILYVTSITIGKK